MPVSCSVCSGRVGLVYAVAWIGALLHSYAHFVGCRVGSPLLVAPLLRPISVAMNYVALLVACTLIIFWKHRANIERLIDGTEPRIGKSKA